MNTFKTLNTDSMDLNRVQDNVDEALTPILKNPAINGNILKSISLSTGSNTINHGLGRALQGWSLIRQRALASIYDTQDANLNPTKTLLLTSSAAVVVDLYCF